MAKYIPKPFWYWGTIVALLALALIVGLVGAVVTAIFRLDWVQWKGDRMTLFVLCGTIAYLFSVVAGGMLILGVILFPESVRKKGK